MNNPVLHAALDLSGNEASFAVAVNPKPIFEVHHPMRGRSAASLLPWMQSLMQQHNLELNQIVQWTVGSGPGSFSGLRMAAALIQGLTFGKEQIKTRCLPTALGLASAITDAADGEKTACLFDGRNHELLVYGVTHRNGGLIPDGVAAVINAANADTVLQPYKRLAAFARDTLAIAAILPDLTSKLIVVEHLPVAAMMNIDSDNWNNDLTGLVYIRQAVFAIPNH